MNEFAPAFMAKETSFSSLDVVKLTPKFYRTMIKDYGHLKRMPMIMIQNGGNDSMGEDFVQSHSGTNIIGRNSSTQLSFVVVRSISS
jgi:hypothetical protein